MFYLNQSLRKVDLLISEKNRHKNKYRKLCMYRNAELKWKSHVMAKLKNVLQCFESLKEFQFCRNIVFIIKKKKFLAIDKTVQEGEKAPTCPKLDIPGTLLVFSGEARRWIGWKRQKSRTWYWGTGKRARNSWEGIRNLHLSTTGKGGRTWWEQEGSAFPRGLITPGCAWQRTFLLSTEELGAKETRWEREFWAG